MRGRRNVCELMFERKVCEGYSTHCGIICAFVPPILCLGKMNHGLDDLQRIFCIKLWRTFWLSDRITVFLSFCAEYLPSWVITNQSSVWTSDLRSPRLLTPVYLGWNLSLCSCLLAYRKVDYLMMWMSGDTPAIWPRREKYTHTLVSTLIQSLVFFFSVPSFLHVA